MKKPVITDNEIRSWYKIATKPIDELPEIIDRDDARFKLKRHTLIITEKYIKLLDKNK